MGNVVNGWIKDLKVGDTVWVTDRWRPRPSGRLRKVVAIGRIYVTIDHGFKVRRDGTCRDQNYDFWQSERHYIEHCERGQAWSRLRQRVDQYPIAKVTVEQIRQIEEILGFAPSTSSEERTK